MYSPSYWMRKSGVPILSRQQIDHIGEKLVMDFCPEAMRAPQAIDIDLLVEEYLGMKVEFPYLSNNGIYLGMTVFYDSDRVIVYDEERDQADYMTVRGNTVLIDRSLLDKWKRGRYRFTMGHEAAHAFLHKEYFRRQKEKNIAARESVSLISCRISEVQNDEQKNVEWTDYNWLEWQANTLSSAILMPKTMVKEAVADLIDVEVFPEMFTLRVMELFQVSREAADYRLKQLGLYRTTMWKYPELNRIWHIHQ